MKVLAKTMSQIGSNQLVNLKGFTFIEVMVTLAVFTAGVVLVFKTFVISLDRMSYLTSRLYATVVVDNRISVIERNLRIYQSLPLDLNYSQKMKVGGKEIEYKQKMDIKDVQGYADVFKLDMMISWKEEDKEVSLTRAAYISDFNYLKDKLFPKVIKTNEAQ